MSVLLPLLLLLLLVMILEHTRVGTVGKARKARVMGGEVMLGVVKGRGKHELTPCSFGSLPTASTTTTIPF